MKQLLKILWQTSLSVAMILSVPVSLQAQESLPAKVNGLVVDNAELPVIGASVMVEGTMTGTITDMDGKFSINVPQGKVLEISCIGYETISVAPDGKFLKVVLSEDSEFLDEVVVVGFGVQKKVNLSGSVSSVNMDDVAKNRPLGDAGAMLQGSMPGLQITSANAIPGTAPEFNIRGFTSINGGKPLVLVDNVPMDLSMVDPADIENVSILKDASSAAVYGARAAYGVILITTKKGVSRDKVQVTYNNNFAFSTAANLPVKSSPYEEIKAFQDMGQTTVARLGLETDKWMANIEKYNANPSAYPEGFIMEDNLRYPVRNNDLIGAMMDDFGFQHKHNVSVQGLSGKNSYRMSFGYINEDGIMHTDKDRYDRYNVSAYWKTEPAKWLDLSADIKYADAHMSYVGSGNIRDGIFGNAIKMPSYTIIDPSEKDGTLYPAETSRSCLENANPVKRTNKNMRMLGVVNIKPFKGMVITGEYSFLYENHLMNDYRNRFFYSELNGNIRESCANSSYKKESSFDKWNTLNVFANYTNNINGHEFTVMGGYNQESKYSEGFEASKLGIIVENLPALSLATGDLKASDNYSEFATRSLFYRLNYNYKGKYLIETNGRYDGSSRFPTKHRFGFFPSASVAWRIDQEKFAKADWFSLGKIRASVGTIGNQNIANYAFIPTMESYLSKWLIDGSQPTTVKSPAIVSNSFTWEKVVTYDVGVDLRFFDKLSTTFDYYIRDTKDMLTAGMQLPSSLGTGAPRQNAADLRTKGWELELSWKDIIGDWSYNIGFNLYDSRSFITKFENEVGLLSFDESQNITSRFVGQEIGDIWGYETVGLYQDDMFKDGKLIQEFDADGKFIGGYPKVEGYNPNPGDILYNDVNGDGIINKGLSVLDNRGDLKVIGNSQRRYNYAINGGLGWKGLEFSFLLTGVGKRQLWMSNEMVFPFYTEFSTMMHNHTDYWTPENPDAFYARNYERSLGNTEANRMVQTRYLLDGSFLKIKNLSLSYTFPKKMVEKVCLSNLGVFFSAENVFTFYKTPKGINPESKAQEKGWFYPEMRKFSFGINVTL